MYTLKEDVTIFIKSHGLLITRDLLAKNQGLADVVLGDDFLRQKYGHNFLFNKKPIEQSKIKPKGGIEIEVKVKKKADALKESQQAQVTSTPSASTLTEAGTGGPVLSTSEKEQPSQSSDSKPLNRAQRREKLKQQKSAASEAIGA